MKNLIFPLLVGLGLVTSVQAQLTITNGSQITIASNSIITAVGLDVDLQAGGTLTNQGIVYTNKTFTADGTLATEISGTTAGSDYGRVTADGGATLGGPIDATKTAAYSPAGIVIHTVVLSGSLAGTFSPENLPDTDWRMEYTPTAANVVFDVSLPVSWLTFSAEVREKSVLLNWATTAEESNDYFQVERQETASGTWSAIGRVAARRSGESVTEYSFIDASPPRVQQLPYRLRQVDTDGTFSFSPIRVVRFNIGDYATGVYPNPSSGEIFFTVDAAMTSSLELYDSDGRVILRQQVNPSVPNQRFVFPANLAAGTYFLRLGDRLERVILKR
ncbi:T9SS type A sorting domain-containing protein [Neolewinella persica]|uniref:T9SS type A sorting domain-containing protein n=1 Tax=Neolewinella persica TaxID=70998 RepID=UPI00036E5423|nr:T9SS type A sorting domain-containing protein [Neolewinella persica]